MRRRILRLAPFRASRLLAELLFHCQNRCWRRRREFLCHRQCRFRIPVRLEALEVLAHSRSGARWDWSCRLIRQLFRIRRSAPFPLVLSPSPAWRSRCSSFQPSLLLSVSWVGSVARYQSSLLQRPVLLQAPWLPLSPPWAIGPWASQRCAAASAKAPAQPQAVLLVPRSLCAQSLAAVVV